MKFLDPILKPYDGTDDYPARIQQALFDMERRRVQMPTFQVANGDKTLGVYDYLRVEGAGLTSSGNGIWLNTIQENRLINGCFRFNQRAPATNADDTYAHDRWYVLVQTSTVAVSTRTDPEDGTHKSARIDQTDATPQGFGYAQIIEGANCKDLRGKTVTFQARIGSNAPSVVRMAILEWTGTEDAVTSDVVNTWTSTNYTTGNFFASTSLAVAGVSAATVAADVLEDGSVTATLGSTFNNLIVFIWPQGSAGVNYRLDIGRAKLAHGSSVTQFLPRDYSVEYAMCQRYLPAWTWVGGSDVVGHGYSTSTTNSRIHFNPQVPPRIAPTGITVTNTSNFLLANGALTTGTPSAIAYVAGTYNTCLPLNVTTTAGSPTIAAGDGAFLFSSSAAQILWTGCEL